MVIKLLINPFNWFLALLLAAALLHLFKKRVAAARTCIAATILLLIISTPWVPNLLADGLEDQYPRRFAASGADSAGSYDILVLGAGHTFDTSLAATDRLTPAALGRLSEGVRIWKMLPESRLILSGYYPTPPSHAEMLADAARSLGVNEASIHMQASPTITLEEAKEYKRLFASAHRKLIIVTSAVHMPRSMVLFRSQGLDPLPAATWHLHKKPAPGFRFTLPRFQNIEKAEQAVIEWVGMAYTKWWLLSEEERANVERLSRQ